MKKIYEIKGLMLIYTCRPASRSLSSVERNSFYLWQLTCVTYERISVHTLSLVDFVALIIHVESCLAQTAQDLIIGVLIYFGDFATRYRRHL